jgi:hypothetical protein
MRNPLLHRFTHCLLHSVLILNLSAFSLSSQAADSEYEQWLKQTQGEFQDYLDENDKAFIGFLNQKWQEVDVEKPVKRDPAPKPLDIPIAKPIVNIEPPETKEPINKPIIKPVVIVKPETQKTPVVKKPTTQTDHNLRTAKFDFFGTNINIEYHKKFKQSFRNKISNESIADYWKTLASQPHKDIIEQLSKTAKELQLNDWGSALLFDQFSRELQVAS